MCIFRSSYPLILALLLASGEPSSVCSAKEAESFTLKTDSEALTYCKQTEGTYLVVVWPRGFAWLNAIVAQLNHYGQVHYVKKISLQNNGPFLLYRCLHRKMSLLSAKKYFKGYLPHTMTESFPIACIVFQTDQPLETLQEWKAEIRHMIDCGYQSIHINDTAIETVQAAELFFNDHALELLTVLPKNVAIQSKIDAVFS